MESKHPLKLSILSTLLLITFVIWLIINAVFVFSSLGAPYDFGSFYASGQFASQGKNPYSTDSPLIFGAEFPGIDHFGIAPNLNPPISVPIFEQITIFTVQNAVSIWRIASAFFYVALVLASLRYSNPSGRNTPNNLWRLSWALALAGFWHCLQLGQIYILMLLLTVAAWIWLKQGRVILGGVALGLLIAIKPNFVFWAFALLAARNGRSFLTAGLTSIGVSIIPALMYGPEIYVQWMEASIRFAPDLLIFPGNNSFQGLTARFDLPGLGAVLGGILSVGMLFFIFVKKPAWHVIHGIGIITSLLISPIAWTGYTLLAIPILLEKEKWNTPYWVSAVIFTIPFLIILELFQTSFFNFVFWGWFYGWGLIILLVSQLWMGYKPIQQNSLSAG